MIHVTVDELFGLPHSTPPDELDRQVEASAT
jgi:hypothetical protein